MSSLVPPIADAPRFTTATLTNSTGPISIPFPVFGGVEDITVFLENELVGSAAYALTSASGLDPETDVLPAGDGRITFDDPQTGTVLIFGERRPTRQSQFEPGIGIGADAHNLAYTRIEATLRELYEWGKRSLKVAPGLRAPLSVNPDDIGEIPIAPFEFIDLPAGAVAPANPSLAKLRVYAKSVDGVAHLFTRDEAGTEIEYGWLKQDGTGAVSMPAIHLKRDVLSIHHFMTDAEKADVLLSTPLLDHTTFLQNAFNEVAARGGTLLFPHRGQFRHSSKLTLVGASSLARAISIEAPGPSFATAPTRGVHLVCTDANIDQIEVVNPFGVRLEGFTIRKSGTPTGGTALKYIADVAATTFNLIRRLRIENCWNGILIDGVSDTWVEMCRLQSLFGDYSVKFTGTAITRNNGGITRTIVQNQNGNPNTCDGFVLEGRTSSVTLFQANALNCRKGIVIKPDGSGNEPNFMKVVHSTSENHRSHGLEVAAGWGHWIEGTYTTVGDGHGILFASTFDGSCDLVSCDSRGNGLAGIRIEGGNNIRIVNPRINANSQAASNTHSGISIATDVSDITIEGGRSGGAILFNGTGTQKYGIEVENGAGDGIVIKDIDLRGNTTGPIYFGARGVNCRVEGILPKRRRRRMLVTPDATAASVSAHGTTAVAQGTITAVTPASGSLFASTGRVKWASAAAPASNAGFGGNLAVWRGDAAGLGGFDVTIDFGWETFQSGAAAFAGLRNTVAAPGDVDPSTFVNIIGMAIDAGQTTWRIMHNDGSGTATAIDLGANFPANTSATDYYRLRLWCQPNESVVCYSVVRMNTGHVATGVISTDLPSSTTYLAFRLNGATRAGSAAVEIALLGDGLEMIAFDGGW